MKLYIFAHIDECSSEMYCRSVLLQLLLTLFITIVTSQTACDNAQAALRSNQACFSAFVNIGNAIGNNATISLEDLNAYCIPECRGLANGLEACDDDPDDTPAEDINRFICTTDDGMSCFDFIRSSTFTNLSSAVEGSGACEDDIIDGQMCSPGCQTAFQNFIIEGGCCIAEVFEFASQFADDSLDELLAQCPVDLSQGGTCTEIGGANGLKAFGSVLLFAVVIALV